MFRDHCVTSKKSKSRGIDIRKVFLSNVRQLYLYLNYTVGGVLDISISLYQIYRYSKRLLVFKEKKSMSIFIVCNLTSTTESSYIVVM